MEACTAYKEIMDCVSLVKRLKVLQRPKSSDEIFLFCLENR